MNVVAPVLIDRAGWMLLHSVWQLAVVALLFVLCTRVVLAAGAASARYVAGCAALLLASSCPVVTWFLLSHSASVPQAGVRVVESAAPARRSVEMGSRSARPIITDGRQSTAADSQPAHNDRPVARYGKDEAVRVATVHGEVVRHIRPLFPWLVACWLCGVLLLSLWNFGGWTQLWLMRHRARSVAESHLDLLNRVSGKLGVTRRVALLESSLAAVPGVMGIMRPAILLPVGLVSGMPPDQIEALLAHELAHIRRHDYLVNIVQNVAETLFFYHPAVWWISHEVRLEREHCADELALTAFGNRVVYAKALAGVAEFFNHRHSLAVAADGGELKLRITRILQPTRPEAPRPRDGLAAVLAALLVLGGVMSLIETGPSDAIAVAATGAAGESSDSGDPQSERGEVLSPGPQESSASRDAVPEITKRHGPWLVLVTELKPTDAKEEQEDLAAAQHLAGELRSNGVPAYVHRSEAKNNTEPNNETPALAPIAVLAGNYESEGHTFATGTLNWIRRFVPSEGAAEAFPATREQPHPFHSARLVLNPLLADAGDQTKGAASDDAEKVSVRGSVRWKETGEPLRGVKVRVVNLDTKADAIVETDADGRFQASIPPGKIRADVLDQTEDYMLVGAWHHSIQAGAGDEHADVPPFEMIHRQELEVTVVDERGETAPEVSGLHLLLDDNSNFSDSSKMLTDNGKLTLSVVSKEPQVLAKVRPIVVLRSGPSTQGEVVDTDPFTVQIARDGLLMPGIWNVTSSKDGGRTAPAELIDRLQFFITNDQVLMVQRGTVSEEWAYKLDPKQTPRAIDFKRDGVATLGIYRVQADRLTICFSEAENERPNEFSSEPDSPNDVLIELTRQDPLKAIDSVPGADRPENLRTREHLRDRVDLRILEGTTLKHCTDFLGTLCNVPISLNQTELAKVGIDFDTLVSVRVRSLTLNEILTIVLTPLKLRYQLEDGAIVIVARDQSEAPRD